MKKLIIILILQMILLSYCAIPTPYHTKGLTGGFSDTQLAENVFHVSFDGNGFTTRERASDFNLLRCAEISLSHGFPFFMIVDSEGYSETQIYRNPIITKTTGNAYINNGFISGNVTTRTTGGQINSISRPHANRVIMCFKESQQAPRFIYDAKLLVRTIKGKYNIDEE